MTGMKPISVVSAGAGTGKTYRLGSEYLSAVEAGLTPARIIATTFTVKAADELMERVRARLIQDGRPHEAQLALAGLVGTVNSVCGRLVGEFAMDAGLSPVAEVIPPEMADMLFAVAAEEAIAAHAATIEPLAQRLSQEEWRKSVAEIVTLARSNGINGADLAACADKSWAGLEPLLAPISTQSAEEMDRAMASLLPKAIADIEASGDTFKKTLEALADTLRPAAQQVASGQLLSWADWAKLSKKVDVAKGSKPLAAALVELASSHAAHPRLRSDLRGFITAMFACAADALDRFSVFKRERGLLDFVDQEVLALEMLGDVSIRQRVAEQFDILMVDEFQDTSPVQLAVFLELAKAVQRSLWVGDQKQSIFGFRQSDPALINAVMAELRPATGGTEEVLDQSRRSRPSLVHFANALFGQAFPPKGIPADKVVVPKVYRDEPDGFGPALRHWMLTDKNLPNAMAALAGRIAAMLATPDEFPVIDRATGKSRPLRGGDIAVLCRLNDRCKKVADALGAFGIAAAMPRDGLLQTPEAVLAVAAFRYLVDPNDTLAIAELLHLGGEADWLSRWLSDGGDVVKERNAVLRALDQARATLAHLTPTETLEVAIGAARIDQFVRSWGHPGERLANLDALRKLAAGYEDARRAERGAATAAGLIAHLRTGVKDGGERPAFEGEDAVRVLTYHRSKGLEWPVVVLADLQGDTRQTAFGIRAEAPETGFDPWHPLAGRWLRFWPWPYGQQKTNVHLDASAAASPQGQAITAAEQSELVRLFYVGVTRARDYLVFANYLKGGTAWLDMLSDGDGRPILSLPRDPAATTLEVSGSSFDFRIEALPEAAEPQVAPRDGSAAWYAPPPLTGFAPDYMPAWISPSEAPVTAGAVSETVPRPIVIGDRLPLTGKPDMTALGEAIHAFLAADDPIRSVENRAAMAEAVLKRWEVSGAMPPVSLVQAADRLNAFIASRWPTARCLREVPVIGRIGDQRISGRIDLLVETDAGLVLIDHKSFLGAAERWPEKALSYGPQLALYARLIAHATGKPVIGCMIHMPVVGVMMDDLLC